VREEGVVAGGLPAQAGQPGRVHRQQHQVGLAREVLAGGADELTGGREVDEPVAPVVGRSVEAPGVLGGLPVGGGQDLVDRVGVVGHGVRLFIGGRLRFVFCRRSPAISQASMAAVSAPPTFA